MTTSVSDRSAVYIICFVKATNDHLPCSSCPEPPGAARTTQSSLESPGAARSRPEPPGAARSRPEPPGAARSRPEPPGAARAVHPTQIVGAASRTALSRRVVRYRLLPRPNSCQLRAHFRQINKRLCLVNY